MKERESSRIKKNKTKQREMQKNYIKKVKTIRVVKKENVNIIIFFLNKLKCGYYLFSYIFTSNSLNIYLIQVKSKAKQIQ